MKPAAAATSAVISAVLSLAGLGAGAANALPRADAPLPARVAGPPAVVQQARVVCNERGCWHVGPVRKFSWYRPYGYYRPYTGDPRAALGNWHFGLSNFGAGTYYDLDGYY